MRSEVIRMASAEPSVNFNLLHRTCKLVVLLCFLHISVTVFFYVRSLDIRVAFVQNQQTRNGTAEAHPPLDAKEAEQAEDEQAGKSLKKCPETSPLLVGPLRVEFNIPVSLDTVRKENTGVRPGGRYKPDDCVALQKVAIVIPFRKRDEHLKFWLYYLHPILQRQQLDYGVYVINQDGDEIFNRAKLLNVGYVEAMKEYDYECFVFSDVDLIPMDDRNIYKCFSQPRHLSVSMDKFGFRLPYNQYFGGVSSMMKEQYLSINGFPNNYWGWGGEDDDIYNRLAYKGMTISRPSGEVGKCRMIRHERDKQNEPNPQRFDRISHTRQTMYKDGINYLSYKLVSKETLALYTKITVDIGKP
ncbi:LOW QUALITY PROTEIN: beta-1,4-galactosyltransferase 1 [Phycodurus eques]|uniref:LOW QUALITY PROTEIN: beta-1,4-galactosyltransferase 1 n=1 Tax=Phycodurus eques TaxID=693459 RepID=UPI002ACDBFB1|nr:LOW QUALITY PROTEIN: beta-1,4-galactosyltransferase 1 [Phycodurus eques]